MAAGDRRRRRGRRVSGPGHTRMLTGTASAHHAYGERNNNGSVDTISWDVSPFARPWITPTPGAYHLSSVLGSSRELSSTWITFVNVPTGDSNGLVRCDNLVCLIH